MIVGLPRGKFVADGTAITGTMNVTGGGIIGSRYSAVMRLGSRCLGISTQGNPVHNEEGCGQIDNKLADAMTHARMLTQL